MPSVTLAINGSFMCTTSVHDVHRIRGEVKLRLQPDNYFFMETPENVLRMRFVKMAHGKRVLRRPLYASATDVFRCSWSDSFREQSVLEPFSRIVNNVRHVPLGNTNPLTIVNQYRSQGALDSLGSIIYASSVNGRTAFAFFSGDLANQDKLPSTLLAETSLRDFKVWEAYTSRKSTLEVLSSLLRQGDFSFNPEVYNDCGRNVLSGGCVSHFDAHVRSVRPR